jgi:DNA-directed RNA polymerase specialized sigma24 family protein
MMTKADKILELLAKGLEPEAIAARLGCPLSSVRSARYYATPKGTACRQAHNATRRERRRQGA